MRERWLAGLVVMAGLLGVWALGRRSPPSPTPPRLPPAASEARLVPMLRAAPGTEELAVSRECIPFDDVDGDPRARLQGWVSWQRSGALVDSADVRVLWSGLDGVDQERSAVVADGHFALVLPAGCTLHRVEVLACRSASLPAPWQSSAEVDFERVLEAGCTEELSIQVDEAIELCGVVVDARSGRPIPDVSLRPLPASFEAHRFEARTDEEGRFHLFGLTTLALEDGSLDLDVVHRDHVTRELCIVVPPSGSRSDLSIALEPGLWLEGRVCDAEGAATPSVTVVARAREPDTACRDDGALVVLRGEEFRTTADAEGRFRVGPFAEGDLVELEAARDGSAARTRLEVAVPATAAAQLLLPRERPIPMELRWPDGRPAHAEEVEVTVTDPGGATRFVPAGAGDTWLLPEGVSVEMHLRGTGPRGLPCIATAPLVPDESTAPFLVLQEPSVSDALGDEAPIDADAFVTLVLTPPRANATVDSTALEHVRGEHRSFETRTGREGQVFELAGSGLESEWTVSAPGCRTLFLRLRPPVAQVELELPLRPRL